MGIIVDGIIIDIKLEIGDKNSEKINYDGWNRDRFCSRDRHYTRDTDYGKSIRDRSYSRNCQR